MHIYAKRGIRRHIMCNKLNKRDSFCKLSNCSIFTLQDVEGNNQCQPVMVYAINWYLRCYGTNFYLARSSSSSSTLALPLPPVLFWCAAQASGSLKYQKFQVFHWIIKMNVVHLLFTLSNFQVSPLITDLAHSCTH